MLLNNHLQVIWAMYDLSNKKIKKEMHNDFQKKKWHALSKGKEFRGDFIK